MNNMQAIKTETQELDQTVNRTQESQFYLEMSAQPIRPAGSEYLGTLAVHVYSQKFAMKQDFMFAAHADSSIPEQVTVEALKDLRNKAMISYGKKPPAER